MKRISYIILIATLLIAISTEAQTACSADPVAGYPYGPFVVNGTVSVTAEWYWDTGQDSRTSACHFNAPSSSAVFTGRGGDVIIDGTSNGTIEYRGGYDNDITITGHLSLNGNVTTDTFNMIGDTGISVAMNTLCPARISVDGYLSTAGSGTGNVFLWASALATIYGTSCQVMLTTFDDMITFSGSAVVPAGANLVMVSLTQNIGGNVNGDVGSIAAADGDYRVHVNLVTDCECTYTVSPINMTNSGIVYIVASTTNCAWWAGNANVDWITFANGVSGIGGTGSGPLYYYLSPNTTSTTRIGAFNLDNGAIVWVTQPPSLMIVNAAIQTNQFGFDIQGEDGLTVVTEASPSLANPDWVPVGTNVLTGGLAYFTDVQWTNLPARFYRLRSP